MKFAGKWKGCTPKNVMSPLTHSPPPYRRENELKPTAKFVPGPASVKPSPMYSGAAIGIATMHKSNAVPVFSRTEAEEIARMRR